ncbi:hypothetical protein TrispH2_008049 [Trichoplax sp. H2]|nr:hypothetical protein TrispH2_008049 [Trichoplax sp. H2]|eukprot:RDD40792.1 hypothetical protein TrispH2_008049 [Trichoplax sp. H2]
MMPYLQTKINLSDEKKMLRWSILFLNSKNKMDELSICNVFMIGIVFIDNNIARLDCFSDLDCHGCIDNVQRLVLMENFSNKQLPIQHDQIDEELIVFMTAIIEDCSIALLCGGRDKTATGKKGAADRQGLPNTSELILGPPKTPMPTTPQPVEKKLQLFPTTQANKFNLSSTATTTTPPHRMDNMDAIIASVAAEAAASTSPERTSCIKWILQLEKKDSDRQQIQIAVCRYIARKNKLHKMDLATGKKKIPIGQERNPNCSLQLAIQIAVCRYIARKNKLRKINLGTGKKKTPIGHEINPNCGLQVHRQEEQVVCVKWTLQLEKKRFRSAMKEIKIALCRYIARKNKLRKINLAAGKRKIPIGQERNQNCSLQLEKKRFRSAKKEIKIAVCRTSLPIVTRGTVENWTFNYPKVDDYNDMSSWMLYKTEIQLHPANT